MAAGDDGYAQAAVTSDNFPADRAAPARVRGIVLLDFQRERPIIFLHEPWLGFFGRRDVLCLWSNAGRRELGLEGFDDAWSPDYRFAFVVKG